MQRIIVSGVNHDVADGKAQTAEGQTVDVKIVKFADQMTGTIYEFPMPVDQALDLQGLLGPAGPRLHVAPAGTIPPRGPRG